MAYIKLVMARKVRSVAVEDATAVIECALKSVLDVGDRDIFTGRVEALYLADDFTGGLKA